MTPNQSHIAGLELALAELSTYCAGTKADAVYVLAPLITQAKAAPEPVQGEAVEPFAWAEFDGEGGHDLRLYENNEDFQREYVKRNGDKYASWVFPLYTAAAKPDAEPVGEVVERRTAHTVGYDGVLYATAIIEDRVPPGTKLYVAPPSPAPDADLVGLLRDIRFAIAQDRTVIDARYVILSRIDAKLAELRK